MTSLNYKLYKCQNICVKNQDIYLLISYTSVSSKPSKRTFIYIYIYIGICVCVLFETVCLRRSPRKVSILSPAGFVISPVKNLLLGLTPENILKFEIFSGETSSPHRDTETGCEKGVVKTFTGKH